MKSDVSGIDTVDDDIICTEKIIADRKTFFLDLKSNARGRVVRITEKVSSNRDRIMVPAEILDDFIAALEDIRRANNENWLTFSALTAEKIYFVSRIDGHLSGQVTVIML